MYIFPHLIIAPVPAPPGKEATSNLRAPSFHFSSGGQYEVVHYPPYDRVRSEHKLEIHLKASSADEAEDRSRLIADEFLASLTLVVGQGRYHAELKKLKSNDEDHEFSSWSQTITGMKYDKPTTISADQIEMAKDLCKSLSANSTVENSYGHLLTAWKLLETSGSKPLRRSILQHFVLSIEAIVNSVMADHRASLKEDIERREEEFSSEFFSKINSTTNKPKAIRDASTKLREISGVNFIPAVNVVAKLLSIPPQIAYEAQSLYRMRSRSLSHPGKGSQQDQDSWLERPPAVSGVGKADRVARSFLLAYCTQLKRASEQTSG